MSACRILVLAVILVLLCGAFAAAQEPAQAVARPRCTISGTARAGEARLPGVAISVTSAQGLAPLVTSSGLNGTYVVTVGGPGRYELQASLAAFAPFAADIEVGPGCDARFDIQLTLASRMPGAAPVQARPIPAARARAPQQFQALSPVPDAAGIATVDPLGGAQAAESVLAHLSLPPGFSPDTLSQSIAAFGATGQTNDMLLWAGRGEGMFGREVMAGMPGMPGAEGDPLAPGVIPGMPGGFPGMPGDPGAAGAAGPPGGGRGGMGGGPGAVGGGRGMAGGPGGGGLAGRLAMAGQRMNNRPRVQASYNLGASALDAAPYSLTGQPVEKPGYLQQRVTFSVGGPLKIPKLFDAGPRTSFFLNYSGNHASNVFDEYSTVPTLAQRAGDFSALAASLIDPLTGEPFAHNQIPAGRMNPAALSLLNYIPLPNQPGDRQNFYYSTTNDTSADDVNIRIVRTFGSQARRPGRPGLMGGGAGPRGGGGPGGAMGGGVNLNVGFHYSRSKSTRANAFPALGGTSTRSGWDVPVNLNFSRWGLLHSFRFQFNRSRSDTFNAFAFLQDVAGEAGIDGVATDPFDWGVPSLSFSSITSLRDVTPSLREDRTLTFAHSVVKMRGRHAIRFGGEYRDQRLDSRTDASARGSFVFTGLYTGGGTRLGGFDVADYLLGLAQQASVAFGPGLERFRSRAWSLYVQDDWRVRSTLTLNAGLRYEYQSPYREADDRLANLDVAEGFTAAVPVRAGETGAFTGSFPASLVEPDRNNLAPRIGVAWRPRAQTVLRGGYGINYASVPYLSLAQRMAGQPPFAVTDTRIGTSAGPVPITEAFATPPGATITNTFGVDRHYRIGYVHIWNVDLQRELGRTFSAGVTYTGTKGSALDIQRAPNRGPTGLRIEGVQPFIWESSEGRSTMHAVSFRLRRRLAQGLAGGAAYTLSKAMDNASTIGGGAGVVAQNDLDLDAEWGLSGFDQRHRFSADVTLELPFGANRRWLSGGGFLSDVFGGWIVNGTVSMASGSLFTPRVLGDVGDVARGTNGTLRADYNGAPVAIDDPSPARWFNTDAFTVPRPGTFGSAARNAIRGPGSTALNVALMKTIPVGGTRGVSLRIQASNVLNSVQYSTIDTVVNSPTFGQVVGVRPMRRVQVNARFAF